MLAANTILQDRYRIVRLLGKGGMGAVYEAIDQRVSCVVALKEYLIGQQNEARQAFQREAALLANLRHSALPKVMDYFDDPRGDFLVMEYIPGHDLAALLALRDAPFRLEQVIRWAVELLRVLEYLHTREPPILHRDIKPANLKVTKDDEVFLLDFGLAKGAAGQMATLETSKSVPGYTPVYASLEQILGQGTDPRSDLYSLGATLYHLLTGEAPVSAPARFDAIENDRPDPLPPANRLNSQVTMDIATLVSRAMALSRKDRPASAREMLVALERTMRAAAESDMMRDRAEAALIKTLPYPPEIDPAKPLVADQDVQFTVYTPQRIKPEKNYAVLAFAHLSKRRDGAPDDEPDPIEQMKDEAARILGAQRDDYGDVKEASSRPVPRGGALSFVPVIEGVTFSPPSRNFTWRKSVHREEFDMWASREVDGQTLNGRMTVFLGSVIIAEVALTVSVDSSASVSAERISLDKAQSARRLRQVFAAYSVRDEEVVAELAQVAPIFGSRFLMDSTHLEPGEDRREGSRRLIRDADVFQLFWSTNSMRSAETVDEIRYAASLGRPGFILPTYWEEPLPRSPGEGLPPPEIERLHFHRIYPGAISRPAFDRASQRSSAKASAIPIEWAPAASPPTEPDNAPTGELPPLLETIHAPLPAPGYLEPRPAPMMPARRRKGLMMPLFAGAAMVLLVAILAPVWFMMSRPSSTPNLIKNSNTSPSSNTTSNPAPAPPQSFTNTPGMAFVYIPGGKFMMGSDNGGDDEKPVHSVTISKGFYMGKYEVTQGQWYAVMSTMLRQQCDKGYPLQPSCSIVGEGDNYPMYYVSWEDASSFVQRLNLLNDGYVYRLPTEAEWEYACRAGTTADYAGDLDSMAWYGNNSGNGYVDAATLKQNDKANYGQSILNYGGRTHPVGTKAANRFGLFDMHGNVWEWCEDWYHQSYEDAPTDGSAVLNGGERTNRVLRGAAWGGVAADLRSASRGKTYPAYRGYGTGFRVVAVVRTQ